MLVTDIFGRIPHSFAAMVHPLILPAHQIEPPRQRRGCVLFARKIGSRVGHGSFSVDGVGFGPTWTGPYSSIHVGPTRLPNAGFPSGVRGIGRLSSLTDICLIKA